MLTHCLPMPSILGIIQGIHRNQFKCTYLKNQRLFVHISMQYQNLCKIYNILKKKVEPHSLSISKIIHCEKRGYWNAYRPGFTRSCRSKCVNGSHTVQNSAKADFYPKFSSLWTTKMWKTSFLVTFESLGFYVNPLSADARYYRFKAASLRQPIQMHLS